MPDASALYPQPPAAPQPNAGLAGDPLRAISALSTINSLFQSQARFGAQQAIGRAWQNAINPDGSVDRGKLAAGIKSDPAAALVAPEATGTMLDQHGKMISNATAQFNQSAAQNSLIMDGIGSLANKPDLSIEDVRHFVTTAARNTGIPSFILSGWMNGLPTDREKLRSSLSSIQNMAIGSAGTAARVTGAPTATGAATQAPLGAVNYGAGASMPTGQAPGEQGIQEASASRAADLQATASTTAQYHADLDNLKQDSKILDNLQGPTVEVEKKLNQLTQRLGGFGVTMSPDQLRAIESFDKIANQVSLNQSKLFHGSDAGLHTVVGANPSSGMSRYGRDGVIDMLQGNQDAIDTTRKMWLNARAKGAPANSYDQFVNELSQTLDPRVFQFNRLNRDNQQKFLSQLDPDELPEFERKYQEGIARKWVKPLKAAKP